MLQVNPADKSLQEKKDALAEQDGPVVVALTPGKVRCDNRFVLKSNEPKGEIFVWLDEKNLLHACEVLYVDDSADLTYATRMRVKVAGSHVKVAEPFRHQAHCMRKTDHDYLALSATATPLPEGQTVEVHWSEKILLKGIATACKPE